MKVRTTHLNQDEIEDAIRHWLGSSNNAKVELHVVDGIPIFGERFWIEAEVEDAIEGFYGCPERIAEGGE